MAQDRQIYYDPGSDYYRVLGVRATASIDDIRRAYRQRAKEVHPDLNPEQEAWATIKFRQITEAYEVLSDPALRKAYDKQRHAYLSQAFAPPPKPLVRTEAPRRQKRPFMTTRGMGCYIIILLIIAFIRALSGSNGYTDNYSSYSTLDTSRLLTMVFNSGTPQPCTDPDVQITSPIKGVAFAEVTSVFGTAAGAGFASYDLEWAHDWGFEVSEVRDFYQRWKRLAAAVKVPVKNGLLYQSSNQYDQSTICYLPGIRCLLRLTVHDQDGTSRECQVAFYGASPWSDYLSAKTPAPSPR